MLHHGHQLEVGESGSLDVIGEASGQRDVLERTLLGPRSEMTFVDRHRSREGVVVRSRPHPLAVTPGVFEVPDDRGGIGRRLGVESDRIGFLQPPSTV